MNREEFKQKYGREKTYLGDGLYIRFDGYHFVLSTLRDNGINWIGLEPPVFDALLRYRAEIYQEAENITDD